MHDDSVKANGKVRIQTFRFGMMGNLFIRFLRLFEYGKFGSQVVMRFINHFVRTYGQPVYDSGFSPNIMTNVGKASMAGLIFNTGSITAFQYLALGTSATAVAATDTTLGAEITDTGLARAVATISRTTTTVTNDTGNLVYTWTATGVKVIAEAGILNAASTGTLLAHKLLSSTITTVNTDQVLITYTVQLT